MPTYEYRCRTCGATFDLSRPMAQAGDPAACPSGHDDTVKLLTTVGISGRAPSPQSQSAQPAGAGGCCGGACGCG